MALTGKRKICFITGSRAEYGLMRWMMQDVKSDPELIFQLIVTGSHLSLRFGNTQTEIESDGFHFDAKVDLGLDDDRPLGIAKSLGDGVGGIAIALEQLQPDLVIILGDRFEILAAAQAAMILGIPIAHLHGGEASEGVMDEVIRHAITKMSHLHFVAAEPYRQRVLQLGEQPDRVFTVGAPGLDNFTRIDLMTRGELAEELCMPLKGPLFLVTYHPVILDQSDPGEPVRAMIEALSRIDKAEIIFTGVNADPGNSIVAEIIRDFVRHHPERALYVNSLGQKRYLSLMRICDVVLGNSSSGIIEAPAVAVPSVNIGPRQDGRLRAPSIIDCAPTSEAIEQALRQALDPAFKSSIPSDNCPYGQGNVSKKILDVIRSTDLNSLRIKRFYDLDGMK